MIAQNISLEIDNKIINQLLKKEEANQEGARGLKRLVDKQLTNPIAATILNTNKRKLTATYNKDKILIK